MFHMLIDIVVVVTQLLTAPTQKMTEGRSSRKRGHCA